jgi:TolB-like protein/DNA-binding winged helix-turn-helix (wHTH) protein/Tfp pilus assembly protein PilF
MATAGAAASVLRFGAFELNTVTGELRKAGMTIKLRPQAAKVLTVLAERGGELVSREDLRDQVWGRETFVDFEHSLNLCIREIRATLDDDADSPRYVETLPRRGYRFIAPLETPAPKQKSPSHPWVIIPALLLVIVVVLGFINTTAWRERVPGNASSPVRALAVLPLENLSRDPEQEYFADGMTDELITDLAKIHALRVISRNSVMQYKGKHKPIAEIARELKVDAVVEGTVTQAGGRVSITAQLIAAPQDRHLWAESYEGDLRNVLTVQDEVATAIAKQIRVQLTPQEQTEFVHARAVDPEAHQAYLRGLFELQSNTIGSNAKAIEQFQRALAIDANDALAYEGLALAYTASPDEAPKIVMPKAKAAALKAIELDDSLAEAHSSLGLIKLVFDWDWPGAEQELRRSLELNPNSPLAHAHYARYLLLVPHRVDEAIQNCRWAYELNPAVPAQFDDLVGFLFFARAYQAAIDEASKELEDNSPFLALAYAELGRRDQALAVAARAEAAARIPMTVAQTASAYAMGGDKQKAQMLLGQLLTQANQHYLCGMNMAAVYSVLGDKDDAMTWLEKGYRDRSV